MYNSYEISRDSLKKAAPGKWKMARFDKYIDLWHLNRKDGDRLLLYMWNPDRCPLDLDNPKVRIYGYY